MLPDEANGFFIEIEKDGTQWRVRYFEESQGGERETRFSECGSLVDAMAKMLIHLIESKIIKPVEGE